VGRGKGGKEGGENDLGKEGKDSFLPFLSCGLKGKKGRGERTILSWSKPSLILRRIIHERRKKEEETGQHGKKEKRKKRDSHVSKSFRLSILIQGQPEEKKKGGRKAPPKQSCVKPRKRGKGEGKQVSGGKEEGVGKPKPHISVSFLSRFRGGGGKRRSGGRTRCLFFFKKKGGEGTKRK